MSNSSPDRYCPQCGHSLLPLNRPHVARACATCGKTIHLVEPGEGGRGILVRAGDRFTIPADFLKFSLDPAGHGKLYRPGIAFLVKQLMYAGSPATADHLSALLEKYRTVADSILEKSELLQGLNFEDAQDGARAYEILKKKPHTREWHALLIGAFTEEARDALQAGKAAQATWAMYQAATAHAMTVVSEPMFEQTLWRGYLANQVVYEAAQAAAITPGESEAIRKLQPMFEKLDEATLHAWVESGLPIGPRIGVTSLPEPLLLALAKFHLQGFQRKREDSRHRAEESRFIRAMRIKWVSLSVTGTITAAGVVLALLKAIGVL